MRNLSTYIIAGLAVLLAIDYLAPQSAMGLSRFGQLALPASFTASAGASAPLYFVNRTLKGDRLHFNVSKHTMRDAVRTLDAPAARELPIKPVRQPKILIGCDPAFSPLTVHADLNFASRCLADNASAYKTYAALP